MFVWFALRCVALCVYEGTERGQGRNKTAKPEAEIKKVTKEQNEGMERRQRKNGTEGMERRQRRNGTEGKEEGNEGTEGKGTSM